MLSGSRDSDSDSGQTALGAALPHPSWGRWCGTACRTADSWRLLRRCSSASRPASAADRSGGSTWCILYTCRGSPTRRWRRPAPWQNTPSSFCTERGRLPCKKHSRPSHTMTSVRTKEVLPPKDTSAHKNRSLIWADNRSAFGPRSPPDLQENLVSFHTSRTRRTVRGNQLWIRPGLKPRSNWTRPGSDQVQIWIGRETPKAVFLLLCVLNRGRHADQSAVRDPEPSDPRRDLETDSDEGFWCSHDVYFYVWS